MHELVVALADGELRGRAVEYYMLVDVAVKNSVLLSGAC